MNNQLSQAAYINLSRDPETEGFDLQAGQTWIYPTNYPVRDYQYNIIQKALLNNTLVSLPTGLGKTFIAAVVMYNYFRWYPHGKVVFMAPTRPLVKQQVDACYDIMAIPKECTAEITGTQISKSRQDIWNEKRVFFITPQILQNDLENFQELGSKIKCVVFDEAHKARGNHAYCEVIRKLDGRNKYFRVLALSATPGATINDVLEVVQNLLISHLEFRTEESLDVHPYVFHRNITTVVVPLGEKLQQVKDEYLKVLEYYTKNLVKYKVIQGNCGNLTKGKIFMTMKEYQTKNKGSSSNYGEIMRTLNICVTLYHAFELLVRHGLRSFLTFYEEHIDKPLLRGNHQIIEIMNDIREYLGPAPQLEQLPDGGYPEISEDIKFGHPKFYKLRDLLVDHFKETGESSRVIVFFEYRDSVMEAYALLIQSRPTLRPRIFLGQSKGVTQRLQINVVKAFREGLCNVLLSTSIGEEGLDVGEVDLIVCFDISTKSPIRMVQRMGRTGRKKEGKIVVLVTEGKEQQTLKDCLIHKNNVAHHVLASRELAKGLNKTCPRLVPVGLTPKCEKIYITVKKPVLKKNSSLKDMLRTISSGSSEPRFSPDLRIVDIVERIPSSVMLFDKDNPLDVNHSFSTIFSNRIEKQRSLQDTYRVKHSKTSEILVNLLQLVDSKRFNIPMSQIGTASQSKNLKQTDIRNMFFKSHSAEDFAVASTQAPQLYLTPVEDKASLGSRELFNELSNFLSIQMTNGTNKCKLCPQQVDCSKNSMFPRPAATLNWIELDHSVFSSVTLADLAAFTKTLDETGVDAITFEDTLDFDVISTPKELQVLELDDLVDRSILTDVFDKSCNFQAPKTLDSLLNKYSTSIIDVEEMPEPAELGTKPEGGTRDGETSNLFKSAAEDREEVLAFFKLESLSDLFAGDSSQATIEYSPDIFQESPVLSSRNCAREKTPPAIVIESSDEGSPVIGTFHVKRRGKKSASVQKRNKEEEELPLNSTVNATKLCSTPKRSEKLMEMAETPKSAQSKVSKFKDPAQATPKEKNIDIDDLCDFSFFGLSAKSDDDLFLTPKQQKSQKNPKFSKKNSTSLSKVIMLSDSYDLEDFCDVSLIENLASDAKTSQKIQQHTKQNNTKNSLKSSSPSQVSITQMISLVNKVDGGSGSKICLQGTSENNGIKSSTTSTGSFKPKKSSSVDSKICLQGTSENNGKESSTSSFKPKISFSDDSDESKICLQGTRENNAIKYSATSTGSLKTKKSSSVDTKICLQGTNEINGKGSSTSSLKPKKYFFDDSKICLQGTNENNGKGSSTSSLKPKKYFFDDSDDSKICLQGTSENNEEEFSTSSLMPKKSCSIDSKIWLQGTSENNAIKSSTTSTGSLKPKKSSSVDTKICLQGTNEINGKESSTSSLKPKKYCFDDSKICLQGTSENNGIKSSTTSTSSLKPKKYSSVDSKICLQGSSENNGKKSSTSSLNPKKSSSQKENTDDSDFFNFSFNNRKPAARKNSKALTSIAGQSKLVSSEKSDCLALNIDLDKSIENLALNMSRYSNHSDDDFETRPGSPVWIRPKAKPARRPRNAENSSRDTLSFSSHKKVTRKVKNPFLQDEAELSLCGGHVSDDEEDENQDCYDASFVADESHYVDTQMHARYLQSVRSPVLPNRFKIPKNHKNIDVYSQEVNDDEENTYLDDSFVVDEETILSQKEMSELEILEQKLEMQRKKRKNNGESNPSKRRRIILQSDSD